MEKSKREGGTDTVIENSEKPKEIFPEIEGKKTTGELTCPNETFDTTSRDTRLLDRAFTVIREHIARNYRFNSDQMDTGIEISLPVLPARDQKLFREIGQHSHVSLWQTNWAQFRRNHENGLAFSLLLDPGWRSGDLYGFPEVVCEVCQKTFIPETLGGRFCSNKCGAEEERIRLGLPTREEQLAALEVAKSKEERVKEYDDQLREQNQKKDKQVEVAGV